MLGLLSEHPDFMKAIHAMPDFHPFSPGCNVMEVITAPMKPSIMPGGKALEELVALIKVDEGPFLLSDMNHVKLLYSAACAAIRFLGSLPTKTRHTIRNVVL
jgi:hypothetical protein